MKKRILILMLLLMFVGTAYSKVTPAQCWKKSLGGNFSIPYAGTSTYRDAVPSGVWTFRDGDLWWDTDNDILYAYDGSSSWDPLNATGGAAYVYMTPSSVPGTPAEGQLYYDSSSDNLKYRNASAWVTLGISDGGTLDEAYDDGQGITVDAGAITFTSTTANDAETLAIVHGETGAYPALSISNAASDPTIELTTTGAGADITGTSATWTITKAGVASLNGLTITTADALFDATAAGKDVSWDDSEETLGFLDDAVLGFGNTAAAPDVEVSHDGTSLNITGAGGDIRFGADGAAPDVTFFTETASSFIMIDEDLDCLVLDAADIAIGDGDEILFGDALGTGDFTISDATDVLTIDNVVDGTGTVSLGTSGAGIDVTFHGDAGSATMLWDENANTNGALVFNAADIEMGDSDFIQFGDGGDWYMTSGTAATLDIIPGSTATGVCYVNIGADAAGADLVLFGDTASHTSYWDASADEWIHGVNGDGVDTTWYGDTASAEFMWDTSADRLLFAGGANISLNDDVELLVGTGTAGAGDFQIYGTSTPAMIISAIADDTILRIGDGTVGTDFLIDNTSTAGADIFFDDSGELWKFGADNFGVDVGFYGDTAGDFILFDESADELIVEDIKINIMDDTTLTFGDGDDITIQYDENGDNDLQVTGNVTLEGVTTLATVNMPDSTVTTGAFTVTAAMSGTILMIPDLDGDTTLTLPVEADGLNYEFWYIGGIADAHDHTIDSGHNDNFFIGGVVFSDTDDDSMTVVYSDGNSNSKFAIMNAAGGTMVKITCDGTNWYITGSIVSDTVCTMGDQ